jgi:diguanylate cyclase (GGDEF)-like protein
LAVAPIAPEIPEVQSNSGSEYFHRKGQRRRPHLEIRDGVISPYRQIVSTEKGGKTMQGQWQSDGRAATSEFNSPNRNLAGGTNNGDLPRAEATRLSPSQQAAQIGAWHWDFSTNSLVWDARMYKMYGIAEGTVVTPELWAKAIHGETTQQGLHAKHSFRIVHPTQGIRLIESDESLVLDLEGKPVVWLGNDQDVTELNQAQEASCALRSGSENRLLHDPLTGTSNRRKLSERLAHEVSLIRAEGGKLSLVIADINHFRSFNDEFGRESGDTVLRMVAHAIQSAVRNTELVARSGGDEFSIILPGIEGIAARFLIERIRSRLEQITFSSMLRPLTASFVLAQLMENESAEAFLCRAEASLSQIAAARRLADVWWRPQDSPRPSVCRQSLAAAMPAAPPPYN